MLPVAPASDLCAKGAASGQIDYQEKMDSLGKALGRIASGVYIVTLQHEGLRQGVLITWISQASFEPPTLTIAFNKERPILSSIEKGKVLAINILSSRNMDVFKSFARHAQPDEDRFTGLAVELSANGCPVFSGAVAYLECRVESMVDCGDHFVCLAEVLNGSLLDVDLEPMVHIRKSGFQY